VNHFDARAAIVVVCDVIDAIIDGRTAGTFLGDVSIGGDAADNDQTVTAHRPAHSPGVKGAPGETGRGAVKEMGGSSGDDVISGRRRATSG